MGIFYDYDKHHLEYICPMGFSPSATTESLSLKAFTREGLGAPTFSHNKKVQETQEEFDKNNHDCNLWTGINLQRKIEGKPLPDADDIHALRSKAKAIVQAGYYDPNEHPL